MSWGTYYKYEGYLSHIRKDELEDKREELERINDLLWREILSYMSATPPEQAEDEEGNKYPYPEFLAFKIKQYRDDIEENTQLIARIDDCLEALKENPEEVKEG